MSKVLRIIFIILLLTISILSAIIPSSKNKENYKSPQEVQKASIFYNNSTNEWKIIMNSTDSINAVAYAEYSTTLESIGWDTLIITTNQNGNEIYSDEILAYGSGYLEGFLTKNRILNHYKNVKEDTWGGSIYNGKMPDNVRNYLKNQRKYIEDQYKLHNELSNRNSYSNSSYSSNSSNYWKLVYCIQLQLEGVINGYNQNMDKEFYIDYEDFNSMNSDGDIGDIKFYLDLSKAPDFKNMPLEELIKYIHTHNHCTALIKVSPDFKDLWFGHNTWTSYSSMNRIFKEYNFKFSNPLQKATNIMFSSYPGTINSIDDFYITNQDLVVMETTNTFLNIALYALLTPNSLLTWHRAMLANFVAI